MQRILSIGLTFVVLAGILYACSLGGGETPTEANPAVLSGEVSALGLAVQFQDGTYNTVGQTIPYQYVVTNTGTISLVGPVTITDNKTAVTCPALNTVGDNDNELDGGELITCTSSYIITQADLNAGAVQSTVIASAGGVNSNQENVTVSMTPFNVLELTGNADRATYSQTGDVINFSFVIKNTGQPSLGPAQFSVNSQPTGRVNCGAPDITLASGASISCGASYTTTEADRAATQLVFNFTARGGGAANIQPLAITVNNTTTPGQPSGNYTRGDTITHDVIDGEWMLQISRCYGADLDAVIRANPQVKDPAKIYPINVITVPNIGSNGTIYGPPCIIFITAQAGDTWDSIAKAHNADLAVLREANQGVTLANGVTIRVPRNSGYGTPAPTTPVPNEPIRITFPSGSTTYTRSSTVTAAQGKHRYVLAAAQGQTLSVTLTAPSGGLELAVLPVSASALKFQNATLTFSGTVPANGDYYIEVVNVANADRQYTLEVVLTAPPAASTRVVDINAGAADSNPSYLAVFNNMLYFNAIGMDNAGAELWRFDPATNSLTRVKDIFPGAEGSNPAYLTVYNGLLYFAANGNDGAGVELWRFNGADAGRLTDINTGAGNANPAYMTVYNGMLYFSATGSDGFGTELWRTDGTNTERVTDIYVNEGNANPAYLAEYNGALYFSATSNDGFGTEIWRYDGNTPARVTDINPNVGNANPAYLAGYNGALYFSANAGDNMGTELFRYDGTSVVRAADINSGAGDSIPAYLTVFNGELYFSANGNDGAGYELWKYNGTNASRASDVNNTGDAFPSFLAVLNNELYFQANGGDGAGKELWKFRVP